jgi:predicted transcriptional regulator
MIEQLFGSKTRIKLLSLFLNNPGRPFYVREITRKIDEQINSVRRELSNLLSIGIVKSDSSNNKLYYEVNQEYDFYNELRSIFNNMPMQNNKALAETKEEDKIATQLRTTGRVDLAFLTGVFVRQSHVGVDIVIIGDVNKAKVTKVVGEIESEMQQDLTYTVITPQDYAYRLNLNDRFLSGLVDAKKIVIIDSSEPSNGNGQPPPADDVPVRVELNSSSRSD